MTGASASQELRAGEVLQSQDPIARRPPGMLVGRLGLTARLFVLTIAFVLLAEVLIYVPSIANFRRSWLTDRLEAAQIAAIVIDAAPGGRISESVTRQLLTGAGAREIVIDRGDTRRTIGSGIERIPVADTVDLRDHGWLDALLGAWRTFVAPAEAPLRVLGGGREGIDQIAIMLDEAPLRAAMVEFSIRLLLSSFIIATGAAGLVLFVLQRVIVRPVRRLASNIAAFADDPERADRVIAPSQRTDEIGHAENALERMEIALANELRQKRRLAELGLSVSKINHELRNLLTTAQLLGDRLESVDDPVVKRVAPRLVGTLDRATRFCEATLAYGRAAEQHPRRRIVRLAPILAELSDLAGLSADGKVAVQLVATTDISVDADPDQLARALANLVRNSIQALDANKAQDGAPTVTVEARRDGPRAVILVSDNGPGLPERARAHLFAPFQGSVRSGGTGLGLAIASELVLLNGGELSLDATAAGTRFRIVIPDQQAASV